MFAVFSVRDGKFRVRAKDGRTIATFDAVAGRGAGRNNPAMEDRVAFGPLPAGLYAMRLEPHRKFRPPAFRLVPAKQNRMFGRAGFFIHGGTESHGCILLPLDARKFLEATETRVLTVVHQERPKGVDLNSDAQVTPVRVTG